MLTWSTSHWGTCGGPDWSTCQRARRNPGGRGGTAEWGQGAAPPPRKRASEASKRLQQPAIGGQSAGREPAQQALAVAATEHRNRRAQVQGDCQKGPFGRRPSQRDGGGGAGGHSGGRAAVPSEEAGEAHQNRGERPAGGRGVSLNRLLPNVQRGAPSRYPQVATLQAVTHSAGLSTLLPLSTPSLTHTNTRPQTNPERSTATTAEPSGTPVWRWRRWRGCHS